HIARSSRLVFRSTEVKSKSSHEGGGKATGLLEIGSSKHVFRSSFRSRSNIGAGEFRWRTSSSRATLGSCVLCRSSIRIDPFDSQRMRPIGFAPRFANTSFVLIALFDSARRKRSGARFALIEQRTRAIQRSSQRSPGSPKSARRKFCRSSLH